MRQERNYGIDLLRLVLTYMVCILHTLGQGGVLNACSFNSREYKVYFLLETLSYCAVDGFALISGYMATDKPRKYEKLVEMWIQAFFYSFIVTMVLTFAGINDSWHITDMIKCAFPVIFEKFWYFTAFFALFFAIPVLNKFIFMIDQNISKKAFIILVGLFPVMGILTDPFKLQSGYSAIWLMVLYCIGALAKKIKLFEKKSTKILIFLWVMCILFSWGIRVFIGSGRLINNVSPTILFSGLIMVVLFSRLRLKGKIIAKLSPLAFGIYLFQMNQVIWNYIIKNRFSFIVSEHIIIGILYVLLIAFIIFISGMIVEFIRGGFARVLNISFLSKKIVKFIDSIMVKMLVFLE